MTTQFHARSFRGCYVSKKRFKRKESFSASLETRMIAHARDAVIYANQVLVAFLSIRKGHRHQRFSTHNSTYFEGKALREISAQMVEKFKNDRLNTQTKYETDRRPATVNRELSLLASAFTLAVKFDKVESNPCRKVDLFSLDNLRDRYLLPEEEPRLMAALSGPRAHMKPAVIVALGTGMRMREQLRMKRHQVDFLRNIVTARNTKNGRPRDIPMNDDVREALAELCKNKRPDDYVFLNPKTKSCLQETKTAFHTLARLAGIQGLIWKDLRATFGTRLAEAGCDAFTIAQLLGHSDVRVTMRYVRMVEGSKRVAVEAMKLTSGNVLATWPKQPQLPVAVNG